MSRWGEVVEKKMGKPLNYVIMSLDDFVYRRSVRDKFLGEVFEMDISDTYDPEKILES